MKDVQGKLFASSRTVLSLFLIGLPIVAARGQVNDSTRVELKARIRTATPSLVTARAAVDAARARRAAAGLRPAATLSAEVEEVPDMVNVAGARSMRVDLSQDLIPRGRRAAEHSLADVEVERSQIELELAESLIDATVDVLVVRSAGNAAIAARLASEDSLLSSTEDALRARFAVADARYVDVLRLRTERLRVETEQRRSFAEYRIARAQLIRLAPSLDTALVGALVNAAVANESRRIAMGVLTVLPTFDSVTAVAAARRLSALAVRRAEASRRLALSERRPAIAPSLGIQRFEDGTGSSSIGLTAGLSVSLPFTASGANRARLALSDRELTMAIASRTEADAALSNALATATDRYEVARTQVVSFDATLLRGAREEREAALAAYRAGGLNLLELLDFERALAQAEVTGIRSQIEAAEALLQYMTAALGTISAGGQR